MNPAFDVELVAMICQSANSAWEKFNTLTRPSWADEEEIKKNGYRQMVRMFASGASAKDVHAEFVAARMGMGWKLGERDFVAKTDPFLLPWEQLCNTMQLRYHLFKNIIEAFRDN